MGTHMGHVFTLANSIIGVSLLAMPFCFRQCGIFLSILMLLMSSQISRLACHFLMKSAIIERIKNFEMLAFRAFGPTGKLIVEMSIIGFMLGTCVAFFVVIGDLGPNIIGSILGLEHPSALRPSVLIGTAIFVVLPLGLLRNVDSLNGICAASLAFYGVLVLKVFLESASNMFGSHVWGELYYWRPSGLLRCIPIFSMALSCQTQLFEVFGSLPTTPLDRANGVVKSAVNLTTFFYIAVGSFGYIAYGNTILTGNVMMNFSTGASSEIIQICFLMSVAVSFPLVIFPCRASIYSFLYSKIQHSYEGFGSSHIPETRFQCITLVIVTSSLVIGLMIPNIEIVLGLVGSTLGVFICVITPGMIFTTLSFKRNNERLVAQILIGAGVVIMVLGTYANLYATEETFSTPREEMRPPQSLILNTPEKMEIRPQVPYINKDVAQMEKVLKQLKLEESLVKKRQDKDSAAPKADGKGEPVKSVSPELISDHNPQPVKSDEGPKPQPVAPEPPDDQPKKVPINMPESLQHLEEEPKKPDGHKMEVPVALAVGTPEVIKKAVEKIVSSKKAVDPVQPVPPADPMRKEPLLQESEQKQDLPLSENLAEPLQQKEKKKTEMEPKEIGGLSELKSISPEQKVEPAIEPRPEKDEVRKKQPADVEVNPAKTPPKDNLSLSMAQGVPLPLAIKELEGKKDEAEAKKVGREILEKQADKEQREKRDLEAFENEEKMERAKWSEGSNTNTGIKVSVTGEIDPIKDEQEKEKVRTDLVKEKEASRMDTKSDPLSSNGVNSEKNVKDASPQIPHQDIRETLQLDTPCKEPCNDVKYVKEGDRTEEKECSKTTEKAPEPPLLIKSPKKLTNEQAVLPGSDLSQIKNHADIARNSIGKQKK